MSTNRSTVTTPSRCRHPSTAVGSGPASTTTASWAPTGSTSASPWPTSHATSTVPVGGQPAANRRTGTAPRATARLPTMTTRVTTGHRWPTSKPAVTPASSAPPVTPAGQGSVASGIPAPTCATASSQRAGHMASQASQLAQRGPQRSDNGRGDPEQGGRGHRRRGEQVGRYGDQAHPAGQHHDDRATGNLSGGRHGQRLGQHRPALHAPAARLASAAPAGSTRQWPIVDSANPGSAARAGSHSRPATTATASAGAADRRHPEASASRADRAHHRRPQHARRWPGQDHESDQREQAEARPPAPARPGTSGRRTARRPTRWRRWRRKRRPDASARSSGTRPRRLGRAGWCPQARGPAAARPGRPAGPAQAARSPARSRPAAVCVHVGRPSDVGSPRALTTAAVRSPPRGAASSPRKADSAGWAATAATVGRAENQDRDIQP